MNEIETSRLIGRFNDPFYTDLFKEYPKPEKKPPQSRVKRLIEMKNATFKHKKEMAKMGYGDKNIYNLSYVCDPHNSYLIQPHEGEIDYSKVVNKEKFIEDVFNR
jgi:hypothetical protein